EHGGGRDDERAGMARVEEDGKGDISPKSREKNREGIIAELSARQPQRRVVAAGLISGRKIRGIGRTVITVIEEKFVARLRRGLGGAKCGGYRRLRRGGLDQHRGRRGLPLPVPEAGEGSLHLSRESRARDRRGPKGAADQERAKAFRTGPRIHNARIDVTLTPHPHRRR